MYLSKVGISVKLAFDKSTIVRKLEALIMILETCLDNPSFNQTCGAHQKKKYRVFNSLTILLSIKHVGHIKQKKYTFCKSEINMKLPMTNPQISK